MGRQADMCCYLFYRCRAQRQLNLKEKKEKKRRGEGGGGSRDRGEIGINLLHTCVLCMCTYLCLCLYLDQANQPTNPLWEAQRLFFGSWMWKEKSIPYYTDGNNRR